jgi:hypothetical protein
MPAACTPDEQKLKPPEMESVHRLIRPTGHRTCLPNSAKPSDAIY